MPEATPNHQGVTAPALQLSNVRRRFTDGDRAVVEVLKNADLTLRPGEIVALVAPSGTGKSTLLHLAGLLESPDGGSIAINGRDVSSLDDKARTKVRRDDIGFVYQFHHLLGEFTAAENIMLPQLAANVPAAKARKRAQALLGRFGLAGKGDRRPGELSGGEKQRTAIARAMANHPRLILADEPTGNLDTGTAESVFQELLHVVRDEGAAALVATHNPALAARMDRILTLDGGVVREIAPEDLGVEAKPAEGGYPLATGDESC
ncbi:ABC transporter ATP-binding protein [Formicincola oecophyllae]|uniref:ABC transporter ATP-binding protein n=1 Tax=Formicincola oecophyllae TaxID=2558361 RepID=A0A4Y6UCU9_9PROT|nr:ABC transporter ATP-binding protein [Formicincola oecophyllae]QDH14257.1 ABC transporter ATP-binding protein [Formicincola oecophyllae]